MKILVSLPVVNGYTYTGEFRHAVKDEFVLVPDLEPPTVEQITAPPPHRGKTWTRFHIMKPINTPRNAACEVWQLGPSYPKFTQTGVYGTRPEDESIAQGFAVVAFVPVENVDDKDLFYMSQTKSTSGKFLVHSVKEMLHKSSCLMTLTPRLILRKI